MASKLTKIEICLKKRINLQVRCSYSESCASKSQCGVRGLCIVGRCHAMPFPATSQVGTRLPAAT